MIVAGPQRFVPEDPDEIDQLEWLTPEAARKRLTYERDRRLLDEAIVSRG
jgi:hypothetical protein